MVPGSSCHSIIVLLSHQDLSCIDVRRKQRKEVCLKGSVCFKQSARLIVEQRQKPPLPDFSNVRTATVWVVGGVMSNNFCNFQKTIRQASLIHTVMVWTSISSFFFSSIFTNYSKIKSHIRVAFNERHCPKVCTSIPFWTNVVSHHSLWQRAFHYIP